MTKHIRLLIAAVFIGAIAFSAVAVADDAGIGSGSGSGSAVDPAPLPDPLDAPGDSIGLLTKLYKGGQFVALVVLVAFFGLTIASKKIEWLQEGYRKVVISAALGAVAMLAGPAAAGTTPNISMIVAALIAAVTLALNPKPEAKA